MNNSIWLHVGVMLLAVLAAGLSQVFLKKAALRNYCKWYRQYLNLLVFTAYGLLLLSTLLAVFAYSRLPLSSGPVWDAVGQLFVVSLSYRLLGERPSKRKLLGLSLLLIGIILFLL